MTQTSTPDNSGVTAPLTQAQAEELLRHANLSDASFCEALDAMRDTEEGVAAAEHILSTGAEGDTLWAVTYIYTNSGPESTPLRPLLTHSNVTIRLMAGVGLVARGDVSGFDALVEALEHFEDIESNGIPQSVWSVATTYLVSYTALDSFGPPFDADEGQVKAAALRWRAWLDENRNRLRFDVDSNEWSVV